MHYPRAQTLYHHVRFSDQATYLLEIIRILQIGGEALLVPVYGVKERAVAVELQVADVELSTEITHSRALNLDHSRAQIRQPERGGRSGEKLTEVQHQESVKR